MVRTITFTGHARFILCAILLVAALAACGGARTDGAPSAATDASVAPPPAPIASPNASTGAGGPGIDQTKLDVCALLPHYQVEAAIGALTEAPKPSIAIGSEVGCEYVVEQGRGYEIMVYNLDRWELIPTFIDGATPIAGIGDRAYAAKAVGGATLYVLLRGRAVVGARVNGADTPQFRRLLEVALYGDDVFRVSSSGGLGARVPSGCPPKESPLWGAGAA
jgi:hypothetical protein